ncbi:hypothetical protein SJ297_27555 [Klebsiella pneumoniae]|uniref:hypothetical protein n=2 Tax=Klebsiella pneumoniae complex TaxID=3390273 RepID=UPI000E024206|nr:MULTISPECIES: hypothetical protein [Klebsiella]MCC4954882.1 hypothetical protein [Klebsiella pneumoniae]MDX7228539.1 hypothetical protein [Klebsiella pneumoniae]WFC54094.1 hypothetical protein OM421_28510 [Klebsiella pneumoniae]WFC59874.1 hypothetical protein OM422_28625 [Klebsiella pneumoniae]STT07100.1 Uncharacterised protein [Klebsiella pneumoniae]
MNSRQLSYMLASVNLNLTKSVQCYRIKTGHRQVMLLIFDDRGHELARKEFGANPTDWDMNSPAKNTISPCVKAGDLAEMKVVNADQILLAIEAHELVADYLSR